MMNGKGCCILIHIVIITKTEASRCRQLYMHPYNNNTTTELTDELITCFDSCEAEVQCKGLSFNQQSDPQCHVFMNNLPETLRNLSNVWIKECPKNFTRGIYQEQCYMLVEERMTWAQADEYCRDKNAYLAELTQTEERDAVWNYAKGQGILASVWLGIAQQDPDAVGHHRDFKWSWSNENIPSTDEWWANRYVPSQHYPEVCGYFKTNYGNSRFFDHICSGAEMLICEW